jgi:hypothetical protein
MPGIHVFAALSKKDVDGPDEPGHDGRTEGPKPGLESVKKTHQVARRWHGPNHVALLLTFGQRSLPNWG